VWGLPAFLSSVAVCAKKRLTAIWSNCLSSLNLGREAFTLAQSHESMNAMSGGVPVQADLNWQMTGLFLLALLLLGFVMKLVALLLPVTVNYDRSLWFWAHLSPNSLRRLRPVVEPWSVLFRAVGLGVSLWLSYWIYRWLFGTFQVRGLLLAYAALPILFLMSKFLAAVITLVLLPSGQLLPPVHCRPWQARSIADFWGRRWNLWFSDWFRYALFERLRRRPRLALILSFAVSGVMHEWVINVTLYYLTGQACFGSMMIYFLLQAAGLLLERRFLKDRGVLRIGFAWLVILAPAPLVMNEGFLRVLHLWLD
jgi:hypothetical protein